MRRIIFSIIICLTLFGASIFSSGERRGSSVKEESLDVGFAWQLISDLVIGGGLEKLPTEHQSHWESLDIYAVDKDCNFASKPRFLGGNWEKRKCNTVAVQKSLNYESGVTTIADYRGLPVLSAFGPVTLPDGEVVALMVELDVAEAEQIATSKLGNYAEWGILVVSVISILLLSTTGSGQGMGESIRVKQILRNYPEWLAVCDTSKDLKIQNISFEFQKDLGLNESSCVGKPIDRLFSPDKKHQSEALKEFASSNDREISLDVSVGEKTKRLLAKKIECGDGVYILIVPYRAS